MAGSAQFANARWTTVREQAVTAFSLRDVPGVPPTAPPGVIAFVTLEQCVHDQAFWRDHNPALIVNCSGRQDVFVVVFVLRDVVFCNSRCGFMYGCLSWRVAFI